MIVLSELGIPESIQELDKQVRDLLQDILTKSFASCWSWIQIYAQMNQLSCKTIFYRMFLRRNFFVQVLISCYSRIFVLSNVIHFSPTCFHVFVRFAFLLNIFLPFVPARGTNRVDAPSFIFLNPSGCALGVRNVIDFLEEWSSIARFRSLAATWIKK